MADRKNVGKHQILCGLSQIDMADRKNVGKHQISCGLSQMCSFGKC